MGIPSCGMVFVLETFIYVIIVIYIIYTYIYICIDLFIFIYLYGYIQHVTYLFMQRDFEFICGFGSRLISVIYIYIFILEDP